MNIDIAAHISELLYEYDEIIIPDLGAFSTIPKSAKINKFQQISPATKEVIFNKSKTSGDNILIQSIVNKYQISAKEAQEIVATYVQQVKHRIKTQAVSVSNIGRFYLDSNKAINFAPSNHNYSNDAYGLPKLAYSPIKRQAEKTAIQPIEVKPSKKVGLKHYLKNIWADVSVRTILVIFIFIFIIFQITRFVNDESEIVEPSIIESKDNLIDTETDLNPYEKTVEKSPIIITETDEIIQEQIEQEAAAEVEKRINRKPQPKEADEIKGAEKETAQDETPKKETAQDETPKKESAERKNYVIIIGNFSTQANADLAAAQVKKAGYVAYMKTTDSKKHRVGIALSATESSLDSKLEKIKTTFPDAWVMNR